MKPTIFDPWQLSQIKPNPRYANATRDEIAGYVRALFKLWYSGARAEADEMNAGLCLHWTHCACCVLRQSGYRAILQAGSMNWPINRNAPEPQPTHFSYEWEPDNFDSALRIAQGALPECHVWAALPDRNEIVDFSTGFFKGVASKRHGLTWLDADPPEYLWCPANALPEGVRYRPSLQAIRFVCEFLNLEPIPINQ